MGSWGNLFNYIHLNYSGVAYSIFKLNSFSFNNKKNIILIFKQIIIPNQNPDSFNKDSIAHFFVYKCINNIIVIFGR